MQVTVRVQWTSPAFGPQFPDKAKLWPFGSNVHGCQYPRDADFEWRIIDASTDIVIPGFEEIEAKYFDFGIIDWETYPLIKMQIDMASITGSLPIIHGIHFDGLIEDSLIPILHRMDGLLAEQVGTLAPIRDRYHGKSTLSISKWILNH